MFTPEMLSLFWTGICESLYMTLGVYDPGLSLRTSFGSDSVCDR